MIYLSRNQFLTILWWWITSIPCPWKPPAKLMPYAYNLRLTYNRGWIPADDQTPEYKVLRDTMRAMLTEELEKANKKQWLLDLDFRQILLYYYADFWRLYEHYPKCKSDQRRGGLPSGDAIPVRGQASFRWRE